MPTLSFVGLKGGIGKSTAAIGVAVELERRRQAVALVDTDPQQTALQWAQNAGTLGKPRPTTFRMVSNLYQEDQVPRLASLFDFVVIDTPPGGNPDDVALKPHPATKAAMIAADLVIIPCTPSVHDIWSLKGTAAALRAAEMRLGHEIPARLLISRKDRRTRVGAEVRSALADVGIPLLESELCDRVEYVEASAAGQGPTTYAPASLGSLEIRNLVNELVELVPIKGIIASLPADTTKQMELLT